MNRLVYWPARGTWFRLLAVLVGLAPFALAEIGLHIAGWEATPVAADPLVEFVAVRPLFELNVAGDRFEIPPSRQPYFKPDSFRVPKGRQTFRVFCLGGSTVQGNPYSIETAFTSWLRLSLQAADPDRDWEVVNCGGISYASYRLYPILRECLTHQPDLIVLYLGDNEYLEERSFEHLKQAPDAVVWLTRILNHARLYRLARQSLSQRAVGTDTTRRRPPLPSEVDAVLDYEGGLARYRRDDPWRDGVVRQFSVVLTAMIEQCQAAGVPVLVVDPVSNVRDCPPFKVEPGAHLADAARVRIAQLLSESNSPTATPAQRVDLLREALALDDRHAAIQFQLGKALLAVGQDQEARQAFLRAKDEDVCPLRMTEPLRAVIYDVGRQTHTRIIPVMASFSELSPHGLPGDELMLDHVHPTISGQQLIADLLMKEMSERGWVQPTPGWESKRKQEYERHLGTLDAPYYARGQEHLEGLRRWAQGRVTKQRIRP